jgi:hypothetical protein
VHWYCRVYDNSGDWTAYCVHGASEYRAERKLLLYLYDVEGMTGDEIKKTELEPWNTFEHGDINDYEILS